MKKTKIILGSLLASFTFVFFGVSIAYAQYLGFDVGAGTELPMQDTRVITVYIIRNILSILGLVFIIITIYAGFIWMTAGGNDEKVAEAKKWIFSGIIGLAIILSAYALSSWVIKELLTATGAPNAVMPVIQ